MIARAASLLAIACLLSACTTTDPRRGGFIGGVGGLASGEYEQRLNRRQAELDQLDAAGDSLDRRIASARSARSQLDRRISSLSRTIAQLKARQAELEARSEGAGGLRADRDRARAQLIALTQRNTSRNRMTAAIRDGSDGSSEVERDLASDEALAEQLMREQNEQLDRLK